jgi:hypothetical protein
VDDYTCPESHCEFIATDLDFGAAGVCQDKTCSTMGSGECAAAAAACVWHSTSPPEGVCFEVGLAVPCNQYWDAGDCTGANDGCVWDPTNYRCLEAGELEPCAAFGSDQCPADRCVVKAETATDPPSCQVNTTKFSTTPDKLPGKGDGTGNEDPTGCSAAQFAAVRSKLEQAQDECGVIHRRRGRGRRAADLQLECLAYFLKQPPKPTTIADACPCIWRYAGAVDPFATAWMKVAC